MRQPLRSWPVWLVLTPILCGGESPPTDRPESFKDLQARVDRRVDEWRPSADEKRFDQIGWCTSLVEAEQLAREHRRPIFLFTHDGRMNVGRC